MEKAVKKIRGKGSVDIMVCNSVTKGIYSDSYSIRAHIQFFFAKLTTP